MFFISDTQAERHELIRSFLTPQRAAIATVLAAIDFEWSMRRAILALGISPTKFIRKEVFANNRGGYDGYKSAWRAEVEPRLKLSIDRAVPSWSRLVDSKTGAVLLRGKIVHGVQVAVTVDYAEPKIEDWLLGSAALERLAIQNGTSLYKRLVRRKPWTDGP